MIQSRTHVGNQTRDVENNSARRFSTKKNKNGPFEVNSHSFEALENL